LISCKPSEEETMGVLCWTKPAKAMSTERWQEISADAAPPGVYTPNMSAEDAQLWRAKLIGGPLARVEIRKTVVGRQRPESPGSRRLARVSHAQLVVIVDKDSVRVSTNATADFTIEEWAELGSAVTEAVTVLMRYWEQRAQDARIRPA
jgi:hypothetical protein